MFTVLVVVKKREDLPTDEFRRLWRDEYGALCRKVPEIKAYDQYHLSDEGKGAIDGVAVMTFESREAMERAWKDKASRSLRERITRSLQVTVVDTLAKIV